jgi:hypothetical protein
VAIDLTRDDIRRLARLGAARRLEELQQEETAILAAFPDLTEGGPGRGGRRRRGRGGRPAAAAAGGGGGTAADGATSRKRKRRKMSAAEKRAVSERMRKYWAERRKGKG